MSEVDRVIASALEVVQRRAERAAAEAEQYGRLVARGEYGRTYERVDDAGQVVTSLVCKGPRGGVVYQIVGVSWEALV